MPLNENPIVVNYPAQATDNNAFTIDTKIDIIMEPQTSVLCSENQIIYQFGSREDYPITSANTKAKLVIFVNNMPSEGETYAISALTGNSFATYTLTAKAQPKANEFYSDQTLPSRTTSDVCDSIAFALNANDNFRKRFYAVAVPSISWVVIEALEYGAKWNLDFATIVPGTGGFTFGYVYSYDNYRSQSLKDYAIWNDLYINSNGDFGSNLNRSGSTRVAQFENAYTADNEYNVDVSGVIKNYVSTPLPLLLSASTIIQENGSLVNYYLVGGEKYDEFNNGYKRQFLNYQTGVYWALNASTGLTDQNYLAPYVFSNATGTTARFLTNQPQTKQTYALADEYLSILYSNSGGAQLPGLQFYWYVDIYYSNGTIAHNAVQMHMTTIPSDGGGCYRLNVGPSTIGVREDLLFFGSRIKGYGVHMQMVGSALTNDYTVSTVQKYELVDEPNRGKLIQWLNPLGRWDSFYFNGNLEQDLDRKSSTFTTPIGFDVQATDRMLNENNIELSRVYTLNSGVMNKEHFDWIYEIAKSTDIRIKENNTLKPIILKKINWKCESSFEDTYSISIDYVYAVEENYVRK